MNSRIRYFRFATLLASATASIVLATSASAMPFWARRYNVACSACHAYPSLQLNANGLDFLRRGHRFSGDTFDKDLTHLISAHAEWAQPIQEGQSTAFQKPEFHFHVGGAVSEYFSGYVDANVNSDFEASYLQFTSKGDTQYFTARAGKLSPTIIRNYGNGLMASASTPLIVTDTTLGANPFTPARASFGLDVGGRIDAVFLQGGVLNGEDVPGQATVGNHKDAYASVEFNLPDTVSGVGLYYHRGGYDLANQAAGSLFDRYDRGGVFANYTTDRVRVAGAYLTGKDQVRSLPDRKIHGYFGQVDVHPLEWLAPFARFDDVTTELETGTDRVQRGTIGLALKLFETAGTSGRLAVEVSRSREAGVYTNAALFNLIWAI